MFQLEQALDDWRRAAQRHDQMDAAVLAELEDHLREEFAALSADGQAPEEAWRLAVELLGQDAAIRDEFKKLDRLAPLDRLALGAIAVVPVVTLAGFAIAMLRAGRPHDPLLSIHVATVTFGYVSGMIAAALAGYVTIRRFASTAPSAALASVTARTLKATSLLAVAFTVIGFALGAMWSLEHWGRAFAGDPREIGALMVVLSFIAVAATSWGALKPSRWPVAISILGGGVVLAAWFGVIAHSAGYPPLLTTIGSAALSLPLAVLALRDRGDLSTS